MKAFRTIALASILCITSAQLPACYTSYSTYPVYIPVPIPTYTYQTPILYPSYAHYYSDPLFIDFNNPNIAQASLRALLATALITLSWIALEALFPAKRTYYRRI